MGAMIVSIVKKDEEGKIMKIEIGKGKKKEIIDDIIYRSEFEVGNAKMNHLRGIVREMIEEGMDEMLKMINEILDVNVDVVEEERK